MSYDLSILLEMMPFRATVKEFAYEESTNIAWAHGFTNLSGPLITNVYGLMLRDNSGKERSF